ncbi:PHP domain-containing protein [Nocardioides mangrovicus]|uniref:PHP domain-containing protein n=1 Tax=Nocardioides mangrovicus TaxID=2478913 RepID=A0A3L8P7C4_9ACTN|nr:PHP domain-containing protein [Nocardioides mangrovicus]
MDLHTHSTRSDGTASPAELVAQAAEAGLSVVALTDHDTTAGWDEAAAAAERHGVELVRGIEMSTELRGRSVHLLGYLFDPDHPPLVAELERILAGREGRLPAMVARLTDAGYELTEADVLAAAPSGAVLGRPHVADALVARGYVGHRDEAFATLLGPGGVGYVPRYGTPLEDAVRILTEAGGATVVAHPWGRARALQPDDLARLSVLGLAGVEVDHQDHTPEQRAELGSLARSMDLVATGSSDFHGTGKTDHELGVNTTDPAEYARLRERAR